MTWGELDSRTNRLARAYAELGVGEGDFVTIGLPTSELEQILALAQPSLVVGFDSPLILCGSIKRFEVL